MSHSSTLIIGIGSPHGDDSVGWRIAERLAIDLDQHNVRVEKVASPIQIIDLSEGVERLILCDACRGGGEPGDVRRWIWPAIELVTVDCSGTHDFSLTASLQLAERLGRLPRHVVIWTVEASSMSSLDAMSGEVAAVVPRLVQSIASEIDRITQPGFGACTNNHS